MNARCHDERHPFYANYGGRGIAVCDEWRDEVTGRAAFTEWATGNGYAEGLCIDRIDNDGGYKPDNCRWTTRKENQRNRRNTLKVELGGKLVPLAQVAEQNSVSEMTLRARHRRGVQGAELLSAPRWSTRSTPVIAFGESKSLNQWARDSRCVVTLDTLHYRLTVKGMAPEDAITSPPSHSRRSA